MSTLEPFHGEHQLDPRVSFSYQEYHPSNLSVLPEIDNNTRHLALYGNSFK